MPSQDPYLILAESLISGAPPGWTAINLDAKVDNEFIDIGYTAQDSMGSKSFRVPGEVQTRIEDTILRLRTELPGASETPWSACTFVVTPDGKFSFDVSYDD